MMTHFGWKNVVMMSEYIEESPTTTIRVADTLHGGQNTYHGVPTKRFDIDPPFEPQSNSRDHGHDRKGT